MWESLEDNRELSKVAFKGWGLDGRTRLERKPEGFCSDTDAVAEIIFVWYMELAGEQIQLRQLKDKKKCVQPSHSH